MNDPSRWQGLLGMAAILLVAVGLSENRRAISPRMLVGGLMLQWLLGFFLLRFEAGRIALDAASRWVEAVLACAAEGAQFVFGSALVDPAGPAGFVFAFRVLPTIIFVAALVNLLIAAVGGWFGRPELSLQVLLGMLLAPVAWLLGVPWSDCGTVGGLLGTRTVLNELIAYGDLGGLRDTLAPKSFAIATIALCGFANISSIGIQLGGIGALVPERRSDLAVLGPKVLLIATLANFLSASIAGVLL